MRLLRIVTVGAGVAAAAACSLVGSLDGIAGGARDPSVDGSDVPGRDGEFPPPDAGDARCGDTAGNTENCGACGNVCPVRAGASTRCEAGACITTCTPPMLDCDDALATNGCETNSGEDPNHCGGCGVRCAETTCQSAHCVPTGLGPFTSSVGEMVTDGNRLYFVNYDAVGRVWAVQVDGGGATQVAFDQRGPWRIAMDAQNLYWSNYIGNTIWTVAKDGTNARPLVEEDAGGPPLGGPWGIAVDDEHVFWINSLNATVMRVKKGGGPHTLVFADTGADLKEIAVDESRVYWTDSRSTVKTCAKDGSDVRTVLPPLGGRPIRLALDATSIYWTQQNPDRVFRVDKDGTNLTTIASDVNKPATIRVDATHVYFTELPPPEAGVRARMFRVRKDGTDLREVAGDLIAPRALAVDDKYLSWADYLTPPTQVKRVIKTW